MIKCAICGEEFKAITWKHLHRHGLTVAEYRRMGHQTGRERKCVSCSREFVPAFRYLERYCAHCGINDPKLLEDLYWDEELCQREIAEQLGVSTSLVSQRMRIFGIQRRSQAMATHLATGNQIELSSAARHFLDGCLLGDGTVVMNKSISACYQHTDKHREYLVWLCRELETFGIESSPISPMTLQYRSKAYDVYRVSSLSYPALTPVRHRWYPNGKKQPPSDLDLVPVTIRQWFLGDGNYRCKSDGSEEVRLCNSAFSRKAKDRLKQKLSDIGIEVTIGDHRLRIRNRSIQRFFEFIGECPIPEVYGYKWPKSSI